jgi:hypothetical protein
MVTSQRSFSADFAVERKILPLEALSYYEVAARQSTTGDSAIVKTQVEGILRCPYAESCIRPRYSDRVGHF